MQTLRELCRDDIALKLLPQILSAIQINYEQTHRQIRFQAALLDRVGHAVIATDIEGNIIYYNRFAQTVYQWKAEEVIGRNICKVAIAPDSRQLAKSALRNLLASDCWQGELLGLRSDGSCFVADVSFAVIRDAEGKGRGFVGIFVDATERKRAEMSLKQSEANLKAILNSSLPAVVLIDLDRQVQFFNKTANEWAKKIANRELIQGKSIYDVVLEEDVNELQQSIERASKGELIKNEKCLKGIDGEYYCFEIGYSPVFDESERVIGVCKVAINIDREKKAIDELAKSEERFRALVQNSSDIIIVLEADGTIGYASPTLGRILGYNPEEIVGKNAFDYIHPQEMPTAQRQFAHSLKQAGEIVLKELQLRHKSGEWIYVEAAVNNLLEEASMKGVVVNCRDITERKQAEAVRRQQSLREEALNKFTRTLRSYLDIETICAIAAKEISQMLQVDYVEIQQYLLSGQVWLTVAEYPQAKGTPSRLGVEVPDVDNEISSFLKQLEVVHTSINPTGAGACLLVPLHFQQRLWGSVKLSGVGDGSEWQESEVELVKAIAQQLAITIEQAQLYRQSSEINADLERQVQERTAQLEQKVEELQHLNVLKDDFLSTVSHELRTPLANMKMAIQMLKIAPTSDRRQRYLNILDSECTREAELINDLLDLQRLEVANYAIALEKINLLDWLPGIVESFCSRTTDQRQTLEVDIPADLPPMVSDRTSLGRALAELLNNACKYTPPGNKICLSVRHDGNPPSQTSDAPKLMRFTISNQAEIPPAELPRIFEKFYRVPNADPWKRGGTGLGLALVKKLIQQMEGTIDVQSTGGWTTFTIQIPTSPSDHLKEIGRPRI